MESYAPSIDLGSGQHTLWHPYTQAHTADRAIPIVRGEGVYLHAEDGSAYIDAISSWWVNLHGHSHPYIAERIAKQAGLLEHVLFTDFTHPPAVELALQLLSILPDSLARVFFSDNGSTAVETALKIALQYWHNENPRTKKRRIIALKNGFHGETVGAMSLSDRNLFTAPFQSVLFDVAFINAPYKGCEEAALAQLKAELKKSDIACFFFEPGLQGVGGFLTHSKEALSEMIRLCQEHGVITIADEVLTGFGRTGPLFVSNTLSNKPDMICLAKALTGGFLPLGATVCTDFLFQRFLHPSREKALLHGHSYTANPLGCAAACANIDLLLLDSCTEQRARIERAHKRFQERHKEHPAIQKCRVIGTILALEYRSDQDSSYYHLLRNQLSSHFLSRKVLIRPFGNTIHLMPPYCITEEQLEKVYNAIEETLIWRT